MKKFVIKIYELILSWHERMKYDETRSKYELHSSFRFNGPKITFYGKGEIKIGKDSYVGSYSSFQAFDNQKIIVGSNCRISHNVKIYTQSAIPDYDFTKDNIPQKTGHVIIGDGVWIGANVFINPGITIGNNAVIGANSVVTKNIEENAIYGGVPAKLIRHKILYEVE